MRAQISPRKADQFVVNSHPTRPSLRRWRRSVTPALMVFLICTMACGIAASALHDAKLHLARTALDHCAADIHSTVVSDLRRYIDTLQDLSVAIAAQSDFTDNDFTVITSRIRHERLPGVGSVLYLNARGEALYEKRVYESPYAQDGSQDEKSTGRDVTQLGRITAKDTYAKEAMMLSRTSGQITASRVLGAIEPRTGANTTVTLNGPIYGGPAAPDAGDFRGWILMTLKTQNLFNALIGKTSTDISYITISDATNTLKPTYINNATNNFLPPQKNHSICRTRVSVTHRTWEVTAQTSRPLIDGIAAYSDKVTIAGGLLIAVTLTCLTWLLTTSRDRALSQVEQATAALRADIARRELLEARLRDRETELAGFVAVAAHDLKTPLTNVAAYADLLAEVASDDLDATCLGFLERIGTGTHKMAQLIEDLLDFATAGNAPLRPEPVDLLTAFTEVITEHTAHLGDQKPSVRLGALPTVSCDSAAIRRLIDNLIGNAIKYVKKTEIAQISVEARREPDAWHIEVSDKGIGIPEDRRHAIFTAFYRDQAAENYPGTGLGLAICKRIVERHGGHIGVEGNPDGGSRFWFTVPIHSPSDHHHHHDNVNVRHDAIDTHRQPTSIRFPTSSKK